MRIHDVKASKDKCSEITRGCLIILWYDLSLSFRRQGDKGK